ncbi:glycosyltransferase family 4 protein [uncultured Methanobacterium sp.]|uniref:glycosyltransferase family 4 protein n=1 Tax=uncultured Methanobacterium sp. TaxID=176306 RepID=UPI002AA95BFB|nr:glycosyltransferase family 4 protein [uncultured Methanobacterium sp.]
MIQEKLKVAIITNYPSPYRIPVFEKLSHIFDLTVYFTHMEFEGDKPKIKDKMRNWDLKSQYNFKHKFLKGKTISFQKKMEYDVNFSIVKELDKGYDAVIIGGYNTFTTQLALVLCKIKKIPVILWSGNTLHKNEYNLFRRLSTPIMSFLIKKTDGFIVYGTRAKEYIESFGISPEKISIAINVGDINFFMSENDRIQSQKEALKEHFQIETEYNIIFVGSFVYGKGITYLIDAFGKFNPKNVGLILIGGGGPLNDEITAKIQETDNVYFMGHIDPLELPKFYAIADLFIVPSSLDRFSIVMSEAMASGLAVISTPANGASCDLIKDDYNGYVIPEESSEAIESVFRKIFENPEKLEKMGENSKKCIKEVNNTDKTVEGFVNAVNYVVNLK